jgi:hypothetical protein
VQLLLGRLNRTSRALTTTNELNLPKWVLAICAFAADLWREHEGRLIGGLVSRQPNELFSAAVATG